MSEYRHILNSRRYLPVMRSIEQYAHVLGYNMHMRPVKPWDLLNKDNWTMEEVRNKRLEICGECEHFNKLRQCDMCHCFMDAKTWLENAFCPLRKW